MRRILFSFFLFVTCFFWSSAEIFAQKNLSRNTITVLQNDFSSFEFESKIEIFDFAKINTEQGTFARILLGDAYFYTGKSGTPEFPVFHQLIEIPAQATPIIEIIDEKWEEYQLSYYTDVKYLYPSQPSYPKQATNYPFIFDKIAYTTNADLSSETVKLVDLGILRALHMGKLIVSPLQYNPATGIFKLLKYIKVRIHFSNPNIEKTINEKLRTRSIYHRFGTKTMTTKSMAFSGNNAKENIPVKYVIISDNIFKETLRPFIEWKTQKGFEVITAYTNQIEVGKTTQSIKHYLQQLYESATPDNPAPVFLLLVGDVAQIPSFYMPSFYSGFSGHFTDLYYAEYTDDFYPELFYGRFSASDTVQLTNMIAKTIEYEKYQMSADNYLNDVLLVAGTETEEPAPIATNGVINYVENIYLKLNTNLATKAFYNPESKSKVSEIQTELSAGKSLVLYTGHCASNGWNNPSIKTNQLGSITNMHKYFFSINNCCSSSKFDEPECFGEALLRKAQSGAIGVIGASNETLWYEDYYWSVGAKKPMSLNASYNADYIGAFDRLFHTHNEVEDIWAVTLSEILQAGNLSVTRSSSTFERYYWEAYNLLGDPSLMPYIGTPTTMTLLLPDSVERGSSTLTVRNVEKETYICVSQNNNILGVAFAEQNGNLQIPLSMPILDAEDILVVASNQFMVPVIQHIPIKASQGIKLCLSNYIFSDTMGNALTSIKNGQKVLLSLELVNAGNTDADSLWLEIVSIGNYFTTQNNKFEWGNITANSTEQKSNIFQLQAKDDLKDWQSVQFNLEMNTKNQYATSANIQVQISAPNLEISNVRLSTKPKPNISTTLTFAVTNNGRNDLDSVFFILESNSKNLVPTNDSLRFEHLLATNSQTAFSYHVQLVNTFQPNDTLILNVKTFGGKYEAQNRFLISLQDIVADFENDNLSCLPFENKSYSPWSIVSSTNIPSPNNCIQSGKVDDLEQSILSLPVELSVADSIYFSFRVSSESDYDYLHFYIDSKLIQSWSGEIPWKKVSFPLLEGKHTLQWIYYKDGDGASGQDAAWIDNIVLPAGITMQCGNAPVFAISENKTPENVHLTLFPNPAKDRLTIRFDSGSENTLLAIYDISGHQKWWKRFDKNNIQIIQNIELNTSGWESGIYFLIVSRQNQVQSRKFVIVK